MASVDSANVFSWVKVFILDVKNLTAGGHKVLLVHLITAINLGPYINLGSEINWTGLFLVLTWRKQSYDSRF